MCRYPRPSVCWFEPTTRPRYATPQPAALSWPQHCNRHVRHFPTDIRCEVHISGFSRDASHRTTPYAYIELFACEKLFAVVIVVFVVDTAGCRLRSRSRRRLHILDNRCRLMLTSVLVCLPSGSLKLHRQRAICCCRWCPGTFIRTLDIPLRLETLRRCDAEKMRHLFIRIISYMRGSLLAAWSQPSAA